MKTIKIFVATALALLTLASCDHKLHYNVVPFVALDNANFSVAEDGGTVEVGVSARNITEPVTVSYTIGGTAKDGVHYKLVNGNNGVLSFNGSGTQKLQFQIIDHPNEFLGNQTVTIALDQVPEGVELGALKSLSFTILDNDIPVDWEFIEGTWTAQDYDNGAPDGDPYKVAFKKIDDTTIALSNLWGGGTVLQGTIAFDAATNSASMAFPALQNVFDASAYGYGNLLLIGDEGAGWSTSAAALATANSGGITLGPWNMVITAGTYAGYLWGSSYVTTFTK